MADATTDVELIADNKSFLPDNTIVLFYDEETTGLDTTKDCIIQFCAKVSPHWLEQFPHLLKKTSLVFV